MKKHLLLAFAFALAGTFAMAQESTTPKDPAQQNDPAAQTKPDDKSNTPAQPATGAESKNESSSKDMPAEGQSKVKASNNALTEQLHDKFAADPALANVRFHVSKGVVTLDGKVDSAEQVTHAKELAMSVEGVKTVRNRLKVASTSAAANSDANAGGATAGQKDTTPDLKPNVAGNQGVENNSTGSIGKDASGTNSQISAGGNNSTTPTTNASGGTVPSNAGSIAGNTAAASGTQSGTLPAGDQSAAASSSSGDSASLQSTIQDKLKSEPMLSSSSVDVNVTDATIELSGSVATGKEKQTAERIAQSYAGNRKLVNRITVSGNGSSSSSGQATPVQPDKSAPTSANPSSTNGNPPTNQTPSIPEQSTEPKK